MKLRSAWVVVCAALVVYLVGSALYDGYCAVSAGLRCEYAVPRLHHSDDIVYDWGALARACPEVGVPCALPSAVPVHIAAIFRWCRCTGAASGAALRRCAETLFAASL